MERAVARDILMIDTAGRLQNKDNLMAEDWKRLAVLSSVSFRKHLMKPSRP